MKPKQWSVQFGAGLIVLGGIVQAEILPPTDDTSGTLTYNTAKPPLVTKRSLTSLNGTGTTLPVSKTRTAFVRFAVEETGMTAGTVEKARLTLYFPSVTKVGNLSLHVVTQDWEETFTGPTRTHPTFGASFLTIPLASVVKRQFVIVDVTQQVKDWLTNPGSNFGIAVTSPDGIGNVTIGSKEGSASGYPPLLEMEGTGATSANTANAIVKRDGDGNFMVGTITGALVGNATSATTAGSATDFTGALAGDVAGMQGATVVGAVGGVAAANVASGANLGNAATSANTPNTIVMRDGSGNFVAGAITGTLAGNATTATSFTGVLAGDVSGTQGVTTVNAVGGVMAANVAAGANLANAATTANTPNTIVKRDASGNIPGVTPAPTPPPGMVLIPAGAFTMGNTVGADTDITDAAPVSTTVSAFYMDVNEVTLSQWQSVQQWGTLVGGYTNLSAGSGKELNHPVQTVTWYDVVKWCNARSEQAGKVPVYYTDDAQTTIYKTGNVDVTNAQVKWTANGYRLPTEAEWEKGARGGQVGKRFPWGDTISQKQANYTGITGGFDMGPDGRNPIGSIGGTTPATSSVGSFAANGYGLNDMAGNVWEWCWDGYRTWYAGGTDPKGPTTGLHRVLRGGSWGSHADFARCAQRVISLPDGSNISRMGFRSVLPPGQP